ncbi:Putative N-acetylmannosamine-6-phosphate 2-epimerase [Raoultella planticola]|uniref:N-acylglucosamine-6-phosphate 2-epimerase n=1 Tax=Raoultella planticola TaxID=575 RepID=A0A485D871_RAOPL|nr:Putative N-acetylmannosamine-6-phosphate 2-epimerase [Raoultella planticola]
MLWRQAGRILLLSMVPVGRARWRWKPCWPRIHQQHKLAMADCSSVADGVFLSAARYGRLSAPPCRGIPRRTRRKSLIWRWYRRYTQRACRVIAEGRYNTPAQAAEAMRHGAWAVTVGSAITRLEHICEWYNTALKKAVQ